MSKQPQFPGMGGLVKKAIQSTTSTKGAKAVTVKLEGARYIAMRLAAIDTDLSHQEILTSALDAWLRNHEIAKAITSATE
ncbi:hypothetical protein [Uliginosibacterium sp. 31-12]|uniref:hypothetical protein n=1 Tax=Uliginosibacterium sp. 31-12 TaxID=3062781 RepID=UPI0026E3FAB1|nr:hypothetical protein [Uliginosibacterium sp. 31-12]MDO6385563.1 hypothetical protein [Uliginosibacterium sp. 31-12]